MSPSKKLPLRGFHVSCLQMADMACTSYITRKPFKRGSDECMKCTPCQGIAREFLSSIAPYKCSLKLCFVTGKALPCLFCSSPHLLAAQLLCLSSSLDASYTRPLPVSIPISVCTRRLRAVLGVSSADTSCAQHEVRRRVQCAFVDPTITLELAREGSLPPHRHYRHIRCYIRP